jgi:hypothetical protein
MNLTQRKRLELIRDKLLALPPKKARTFDITSVCNCAWGMVTEMQWVEGAQGWTVYASDLIREKFGLDYVEVQFLFQNYGTDSSGSRTYEIEMGLREHSGCLYDRPRGQAGIAEFADRVENVLQYHDSLKRGRK